MAYKLSTKINSLAIGYPPIYSEQFLDNVPAELVEYDHKEIGIHVHKLIERINRSPENVKSRYLHLDLANLEQICTEHNLWYHPTLRIWANASKFIRNWVSLEEEFVTPDFGFVARPDMVTEDEIIDYKVSNREPNVQDFNQLLIYSLYYPHIYRLTIYNPVYGRVYYMDVSDDHKNRMRYQIHSFQSKCMEESVSRVESMIIV